MATVSGYSHIANLNQLKAPGSPIKFPLSMDLAIGGAEGSVVNAFHSCGDRYSLRYNKKLTPTFEAILFDFDGVLANSEPVHYSCWYDLLRNVGIELTWQVYHSRFSGISHLGLIQQFADLRDPPVPMDHMWEIYGQKQLLYRQKSEDGHLLLQATREMLRSLSGFRMGVVTSSSRADVETQLRNAGVRDCFEVVVCRDDVKALKPAPDCYLMAAELLGIRHALVLEDSLPGLAAARAAGFEVLPVVNSSDVPLLLAGRLGRALLS